MATVAVTPDHDTIEVEIFVAAPLAWMQAFVETGATIDTRRPVS